uniref:Cytochrome P450 71D7 n=1 Tax=Aegilops tauschii TaxID=37682 RepID=R7W7Q7_AEGTA
MELVALPLLGLLAFLLADLVVKRVGLREAEQGNPNAHDILGDIIRERAEGGQGSGDDGEDDLLGVLLRVRKEDGGVKCALTTDAIITVVLVTTYHSPFLISKLIKAQSRHVLLPSYLFQEVFAAGNWWQRIPVVSYVLCWQSLSGNWGEAGPTIEISGGEGLCSIFERDVGHDAGMGHVGDREGATTPLQGACRGLGGVKGQQKLTEGDMGKLSYLHLVIKETPRLHTLVPFLLPWQCREACEVMGYHVPEGTRVLVNAWAMARDGAYWEDAEVFKPERFEEGRAAAVDFRGGDIEFIHFGTGRRMCPGIALGLANMELVLAGLLYHFDWELPDGGRPKELDMAEVFGLAMRRKSGLVLVLRATQRIPVTN